MISCAQRTTARALTIPQLETAGLAVTTFLDECREPTPPGSNGRIGLEATRHAMTLDTPVLFVEDDIDLAEDFPQQLDAALRDSEAVTYFYLNDRRERLQAWLGNDAADSILKRQPQERRLHRVIPPRWLYGTQCVLVPQHVLPHLERILANAAREPLDGAMVKAINAAKAPANIALPHPVQHRHDRTARTEDGKIKRSMSFDLPRLEVTP